MNENLNIKFISKKGKQSNLIDLGDCQKSRYWFWNLQLMAFLAQYFSGSKFMTTAETLKYVTVAIQYGIMNCTV